MENNVEQVQQRELEAVKQDVAKALERLGLSSEVSLEEIGRELAKVETAFQSLLILGILRRIMYRDDNKAAELFVPAVTNWKNYLPREDLGGMSPFEHHQIYPPGPYETECIRTLMDTYEQRLDELGRKAGKDEPLSFNIQEDFVAFQKEFFNQIPLEQPYVDEGREFTTYRDIIREERRRRGIPEDKIEEIGVQLFAENTAEGTGEKAAQIDEAYFAALDELEAMRRGAKSRSRSRVRKIRKLFEEHEPYHRCGPTPHNFYFNYAILSFLDDEDTDRVLSLLDKALFYEPNYEMALDMKKTLKEMD